MRHARDVAYARRSRERPRLDRMLISKRILETVPRTFHRPAAGRRSAMGNSGRGAAWNDSPVVIMCPYCGSGWLVPLTFITLRRGDREMGRSEERVRPVATCVGCGEQIYASPTLNRALASSQ
jgi:hypothetical protein